MIHIKQASIYEWQKKLNLGEISFGRFCELINNEIKEQYKPSNDMLRSLYSIIEREGEKTNWNAIKTQLSDLLNENNPYNNEC